MGLVCPSISTQVGPATSSLNILTPEYGHIVIVQCGYTFLLSKRQYHCASTTISNITIDLILSWTKYSGHLLNQRENTTNHHVQMAERELVSRARTAEECSKKAAEVATITQLLKRNEERE
jgi:hypothetical protein